MVVRATFRRHDLSAASAVFRQKRKRLLQSHTSQCAARPLLPALPTVARVAFLPTRLLPKGPRRVHRRSTLVGRDLSNRLQAVLPVCLTGYATYERRGA